MRGREQEVFELVSEMNPVTRGRLIHELSDIPVSDIQYSIEFLQDKGFIEESPPATYSPTERYEDWPYS